MLFVPLSFRPTEFASPYSPEEVMEALYSHIIPKIVLFQTRPVPPRGTVLYEGIVKENSFSMRRSVRRGLFMPIIAGSVEPFESGSKISLRAGFKPFTALLVAVYFGFVFAAGAGGVSQMLQNNTQGHHLDWESLAQPCFFFVAGIAIAFSPYLTEKSRAIRALKALLDLESLKRFDSSRQAI